MDDEIKSEGCDPYAKLQIVLNPDGSLTRPETYPLWPPNPSPSSPGSVLSKDVPLNPVHKTWIRRIYRPPNPSPTRTLPVIINFHGSGFICHSVATEPIHKGCVDLALQIPALVVSVEYRLAPEHRLPAAYMTPSVGSETSPTTTRDGSDGDRVGQLPRCLVTGHGQDPLIDRQQELVRMLEGRGVKVVCRFDEDGCHGIEVFDEGKGQELVMYVKDFISASLE